MPLRPSAGTNPDRAVSPELVLVDPVLAAEERLRLPERPATPRVLTRAEPLSGDRPETSIRMPAVKEGREVRVPGSIPTRHSWRRLAAVAVFIVFALTLLDVHVDVGRTPGAAESSLIVPPAAEPSAQPGTTTAEPSAQPGTTTARPSKPAPAPARPSARRFAWAPVAEADSYRVELFRGDVRVFAGSSKEAQLTVPPSWTLEGKRRSLTPGEYRWYVWPVTAGRRAQNAVVQATLTVP
jgi:hypothetical protein